MSKEFSKSSRYGFEYYRAWSVLHHYWKGRDSELTDVEMDIVLDSLLGKKPNDPALRMAEYLDSEYESVENGSTDLPTDVCISAFGIRPDGELVGERD